LEITDITSGAPVTGSVFTTDVILSVTNNSTPEIGIRGIDVWITYDEAVVEVDDADENPANGVQVIPDDEFFGSDMIVAMNLVEVAPNCPAAATKCIHLALSHTGDAITNHSGRIATIQWAGIAPGAAWIQVQRPSTQLSDEDGNSVPVNNVTVPDILVSQPGTIIGKVLRQGTTTDNSGATITAYKVFPGPAIATATTAADGSFTLNIPAGGPYLVQAEYPGYLKAQRNNVYVAGANVDIGSTQLRGGDVNADDNVNILDLVMIASYYNQTVPPVSPAVDINDNLSIEIFDLSIAAGNYHETGPTSW